MDLEDELIDVEVIKRRADILEIRAQYRMSGKVFEVVSDMQMSIIQENITQDLVFQLSQKVLGKKMSEETMTYTVVFFATWWEHFKSTYFPEFLLKRFPVKLKTKEVERKNVWNICPHYDGAFSKDVRHIEFVTYEQGRAE